MRVGLEWTWCDRKLRVRDTKQAEVFCTNCSRFVWMFQPVERYSNPVGSVRQLEVPFNATIRYVY